MASVTLSWNSDADAISGYYVYRGSVSGEEDILLTPTPILTTTFTDFSPLPGANFYVVKAVGYGGAISDSSNEVSTVVIPPPSLAGAMIQNLVQAKASASGSSGSTNLTYTNSVVAGNLLILGVAYTALTGQPVVTDTQSNVWEEVGEIASVLNGNMVNLILFWALASASGSCEVSISLTATGVWMAIGEFSGANSLAIVSGSALGYGVNPPYDGSSLSNVIQAVNPPLTTPTNSLLIAVATTSNASATWKTDLDNNWLTIAAQGNGIVLAFATNMYAGAPFCDMEPPVPILDANGDTSAQWCMLTAPFTTSILQPNFPDTVPPPNPVFQYPPYPFQTNRQQ